MVENLNKTVNEKKSKLKLKNKNDQKFDKSLSISKEEEKYNIISEEDGRLIIKDSSIKEIKKSENSECEEEEIKDLEDLLSTFNMEREERKRLFTRNEEKKEESFESKYRRKYKIFANVSNKDIMNYNFRYIFKDDPIKKFALGNFFNNAYVMDIEADSVSEWSKVFRDIFLEDFTMEDLHKLKYLKTQKERNEYCLKKFIAVMNKYKEKFYDLGKFMVLTLDEICQFLNEIKEKRYCDALKDEDMFYRSRFMNEHKVEGFDLVDYYSKLRQDYFVYEEEKTKIKIVVILYGKGLDNFIFLNNPSEKAIEEFKKIKDKEIKEITEDGIIIKTDRFCRDVIKSIYPLMKQQYYDDRSNILIIVRDASSYSPASSRGMFDWVDIEDDKYSLVMKKLKENLLTKLYDDKNNDEEYRGYEIYDENKEKQKQVVNVESPKYCLKNSSDQDIFTKDDKTSKYFSEITYKIKGDPRYKDIFNFDADTINKKTKEDYKYNGLKSYMEKKRINYIDFVPQDANEVFKIRFYGDDEACFSEKDMGRIGNKVVTYILKNFFSIADESKDSFYQTVKDVNRTLKSYQEYYENDKKLQDYLLDMRVRNCYCRHSAFDNFFIFVEKKDYATFPIDCSKDYRGYIPIANLIMKSFHEYKHPFSNKIFDMHNKYIEDYLLKVIENLHYASSNSEKIIKEVVKKGPFDIKVFKNISYY